MHFLIFQREGMLKLCLNFDKTQSVICYKRYAYIKKSVSTSYHASKREKTRDIRG